MVLVEGILLFRYEEVPVKNFYESFFHEVDVEQVNSTNVAHILVAVVEIVVEFGGEEDGREDEPRHSYDYYLVLLAI